MIKNIFIVLHVGLVTVAVFFGVKIFYGIITAQLEEELIFAELNKNSQVQGPAGFSGHADSPSKRQFSMYEPIVERDLFKTKTAKPKEPAMEQTSIEELEKTSIDLRLWGTITGDSEDAAYAVIEDTSKRRQPQHLYRQGDSIQNAEIKLILREKVVLSVDGKDEILEMEEIFDQTDRIASSEERRAGSQRVLPQPAPSQEFSINRETIEDAVSNVGNLMRQIRVRPYFKDGNPEGVLLSGIRRDSIFEDMGLKSGDVIKGINGDPIRTVDDAMNLYQQFRSAQSIQMQIERDGTLQTIAYRIE